MENNGEIQTVTVKCAECSTTVDIPVTEEQIQRWQAGELIQNVFPELSIEQREMLISETCNDCFQKLFPE